MKTILVAFVYLCSLAAVSAPALLADTPVITPADGEVMAPGHGAYFEPVPDPDGMDISLDNGVTGWSDASEQVVWYGDFPTAGQINLRLALRLPAGANSALKMTVDSWPVEKHGDKSGPLAVQVTGADGEIMAPLGTFTVNKPGPYRFTLTGVTRSGATFGAPDALLVSGEGAVGAHFSLSNFRGAPSVHLRYPVPASSTITSFYNEVTPTKTPIWSYFMACGFSRGYFGIQVNSPTERRIIFSVWDSGKEPTDRSKVPLDDQVQLIAKGPDVFAGSFGNEGTGGHSHLVYPWKTGNTYRFLVTAKPDGTGTIYTGYFYFPEKKAWGLIASFRAPKDGGTLNSLYSFNEDFGPGNGYMQRYALFGPAWIRTDAGTWTELTQSRFSYTDDVKERPDRGGGAIGNRFFLSNGGYVPTGDIKSGDTFNRQPSGKAPNDLVLPPLPATPPAAAGP